MGQKLQSYFEVAKAKGGLGAQVKLAAITKMSSAKAASQEDSPENIALFEKAISML
ncbi:MAG: hypothetical protein Q8J68_02075 [Methanolobus sp.]|uniref:hypothetical protein n=1 Tax=Methanolobus sp. TaxID=1874737 RepID=UPI002731F9D4|nr:hypothetical protein [Methanolobus sp.]MDP2216062.1 hypothetical protein [Methanolobus sp.]